MQLLNNSRVVFRYVICPKSLFERDKSSELNVERQSQSRFRPFSQQELSHEIHNHVLEFTESNGVYIKDDTTQFEFYNLTASHIVQDVLNGWNGSLLCYGQTGSGKTYTMMGPDVQHETLRGVIPRISEQIFDSIMNEPSNLEFTVNVSFMEIYMERIRDLLDPRKDNLVIHEDKIRGIHVKDLTQVFASSSTELIQVMKTGLFGRVTATTNMNDESSRSHAIFIINVSQKNLENGIVKSGKLFLVDLAGSEKVSKTGASGQILEEAKKINKSLSALGNVINALTDGKSAHIPYRDSKLTRLLQDSLGGNSRTTLIINCSPSHYNGSETVSTLRFGVRAKSIKNNAKVNAELPPLELKKLLKQSQTDIIQCKKYIESLELELCRWRNGIQVDESERVKFASSENNRIPAGAFLETSSSSWSEDERDSFMQRENELSDALAEKECQLKEKDALLNNVNQELHRILKLKKDLENANISSLEFRIENQNSEKDQKEKFLETLQEKNSSLQKEIIDLTLNKASSCQNTIAEISPSVDSQDYPANSNITTTNEQVDKMCFLEKSLEQLSKIQKQLVDQNLELKKSVSCTEKKLSSRSDRIQSLEKSLEEAQKKLNLSQSNDLTLLNKDQKLINPFLNGRIVKPVRGGTNALGIVDPGKTPTQSVWYINLVKTPK